ncbi:MAG: hypothetical protein A2506_08060 [Elusimicrobia bacterium RIFOXYD12_FULL_66_9]|nr:MAG: hypothetical protein A2506_08060 [Elusimicrobia bacterium RIFOXYD12_FULL_66_9]
MQHEATSLVGDEEIGVTFTGKPVTAWGGLVLSSGLARQVGLEDALRKALPFQLTSPNATDPVEKELFDDQDALARVGLTSRADAPEVIWRFYRGHAVIENQIRELKWDCGIDGFCQKKFFATEAAFRLVCATCDLMSILQEKLGKTVYQTLGTPRTQRLACGAVVGCDGRKTMLRIALKGPWRGQFQRALMVFFPTTKINCDAVGSG